jgi:bifunctional non-homologous end joining protein LigD
MTSSKLAVYRKKRDFSRTREPQGTTRSSSRSLAFVVQKHRASHLHYDFRLELDGVLKSWAVPKGPSLDPATRRLAVRVEDHPLEYKNFEGTIPAGNYGAGEVIVWDRGTYAAVDDEGEDALLKGLRNGVLDFVLRGEKLRGEFALVRMKRPNQWLLIKKDDAYASSRDVTRDDRSVKSGRRLPDAASPGRAARRAKGG